ncbi:MAG: CBS domain-containing protein [Candidatus Methanomethylicia archaeon]
MLRIIDIAVREVKTIEEEETVMKAADIMSQYNIGCLVVTKDGKPTGIITERDLLKRVIVPCLDPRVSKVMSKPLIYGDPDMDLVYAAKFMVNHNIKRLPIMDKGKLVGIVTFTDILRTLPEVVKDLEDLLVIGKLHPRFKKLLRR